LTGICPGGRMSGARRTARRLLQARPPRVRDGGCWLRRVAGADRVAAAARAGALPRKRQRARLPPTSGGCPPLNHAANGPAPGRSYIPPWSLTRPGREPAGAGRPGAPVGRALDVFVKKFLTGKALDKALDRDVIRQQMRDTSPSVEVRHLPGT
jgi:hypothetical protein